MQKERSTTKSTIDIYEVVYHISDKELTETEKLAQLEVRQFHQIGVPVTYTPTK